MTNPLPYSHGDQECDEATIYALCLLMPKDEFLHYYGLGSSVEALADIFGVSLSHVGMRMEMLGLHDTRRRRFSRSRP